MQNTPSSPCCCAGRSALEKVCAELRDGVVHAIALRVDEAPHVVRVLLVRACVAVAGRGAPLGVGVGERAVGRAQPATEERKCGRGQACAAQLRERGKVERVDVCSAADAGIEPAREGEDAGKLWGVGRAWRSSARSKAVVVLKARTEVWSIGKVVRDGAWRREKRV